jgi:hypothetical protein
MVGEPVLSQQSVLTDFESLHEQSRLPPTAAPHLDPPLTTTATMAQVCAATGDGVAAASLIHGKPARELSTLVKLLRRHWGSTNVHVALIFFVLYLVTNDWRTDHYH